MAKRSAVPVIVVSNRPFKVPGWVRLEVTDCAPGAVDHRIAERIDPGDVVVSEDVLLLERCLRAGARALSPRGWAFDGKSIGAALARRAHSAGLRAAGVDTGGPPRFTSADRSRFLEVLRRALA